MRRTQLLEQAITQAKECNCIVCASTVMNLERAERLWKAAAQVKGEHPKWSELRRGWYRGNWRAAAESLLVLVRNPRVHLKGAPDVGYATTNQG